MTTELDTTKVVSEATHQGIESIEIFVLRNPDMTVNTAQSSFRVVVAEYNADGVVVNRETAFQTVDQLNAGGASLQDLLDNTKLYYQHVEDKAREFGLLGAGTDSEDL